MTFSIKTFLEMFMKTMKKKENNWILQMSSLTKHLNEVIQNWNTTHRKSISAD